MTSSPKTRFLAVIMLGLLATALPSAAELQDGLISYWPFETMSERETPDLVSGNHLFLYNVASSNLVSGRHGKAASFDGTSGFVAINYARSQTLAVHSCSNHTVAFWVKGPPNQSNKIVFAEGLTTDIKPLFVLGTHRNGEGAGINVLVRDRVETTVDNLSSEAVVFDDRWHHVAWVNENGTACLYIDGFLDVTSFIYVHRKIPLNYLSVGALLRDPPKYFFRGLIDEVAIWRRALNQNEVRQLMNVPLASVLQERKKQTSRGSRMVQ